MDPLSPASRTTTRLPRTITRWLRHAIVEDVTAVAMADVAAREEVLVVVHEAAIEAVIAVALAEAEVAVVPADLVAGRAVSAEAAMAA